MEVFYFLGGSMPFIVYHIGLSGDLSDGHVIEYDLLDLVAKGVSNE